jgi:hypothetical protein
MISRVTDVIAQPPKRSRRGRAKLIFAFLVMLPFTSEILVILISSLAELVGCRADSATPCSLAKIPVSAMIDVALSAAAMSVALPADRAGYFYLALAAWLFLCYVVLSRGWTSVASRLLLGAAITAVLSVLPFKAPLFAIDMVAREHLCRPQTTGCKLFGGDVTNARAALEMSHLPFGDDAVLLTAVCYGCFVIAVIVDVVRSAKRKIDGN